MREMADFVETVGRAALGVRHAVSAVREWGNLVVIGAGDPKCSGNGVVAATESGDLTREQREVVFVRGRPRTGG